MLQTMKPYARWGGLLLAIAIVVTGTVMAGERTTGEIVDDALITTKVKASFAADPEVSALAIDVDTADGTVRLTGVVGTELERQRAIRVAQGIEGVKHVEAKNLHVKR